MELKILLILFIVIFLIFILNKFRKKEVLKAPILYSSSSLTKAEVYLRWQ